MHREAWGCWACSKISEKFSTGEDMQRIREDWKGPQFMETPVWQAKQTNMHSIAMGHHWMVLSRRVMWIFLS